MHFVLCAENDTPHPCRNERNDNSLFRGRSPLSTILKSGDTTTDRSIILYKVIASKIKAANVRAL